MASFLTQQLIETCQERQQKLGMTTEIIRILEGLDRVGMGVKVMTLSIMEGIATRTFTIKTIILIGIKEQARQATTRTIILVAKLIAITKGQAQQLTTVGITNFLVMTQLIQVSITIITTTIELLILILIQPHQRARIIESVMLTIAKPLQMDIILIQVLETTKIIKTQQLKDQHHAQRHQIMNIIERQQPLVTIIIITMIIGERQNQAFILTTAGQHRNSRVVTSKEIFHLTTITTITTMILR